MAIEPDTQPFSVSPYDDADEAGTGGDAGAVGVSATAAFRRAVRSRPGLLGLAWLIPAVLTLIAGFTAIYTTVEKITGTSDGGGENPMTRFQYTVFATGRITVVTNQQPVDGSGSESGHGPMYCLLIWVCAGLLALAAARAVALPHARRLPSAQALGLSACVLLIGFAGTLTLELYPGITDRQNQLRPGPSAWLILAAVLCAAAIATAQHRFGPTEAFLGRPDSAIDPAADLDPPLTSYVDTWDGVVG